jgi:uncharacterized protein
MAVFRIVSFDGGGLKGLISLGMIERITAAVGSSSWLMDADMYAGTSTGGLIALALACGRSVSDISSFYMQYGGRIFDRHSLTYITSLNKFLHAGYENKWLKKAIESILYDTTIDTLEKKVLITSFDLCEKVGKRKCWAPKIFHNFRGSGQDRVRLTDVGLYTTAAPVYLPTVDGYIDGGVCANNPAMCALAQAVDSRTEECHQLDDIRILSFGTGVNPEAVSGKKLRWGILGWNVKLLRIIMDGSVGIADYQCRHLLGDTRYKRFEADLKDTIDMDDAAQINRMIAVGREIEPANVDAWAEWIASNWM